MATLKDDPDAITYPAAQSMPNGASVAIELPDTDDVRELAKAATPLAIKALVDILRDPDAKDSSIIAAANSLLDRAHGKAHQSASISAHMQLTVVCAIHHTPNSLIDVTPNSQADVVN